MNNNELIAFLIEQNQSLSATVVALTQSIKSLTEKINSLEQALREKDVHSQKMITKLNSLSKIAMPKKVEKQSVDTNITHTDKQPTPTPKERGIDRNQIDRLSEMEFVKDHKDLFITGPTGTGKSYMATALGYRACQEGVKVLYANTAKLMSTLKIVKAKGTILSELKRIERVELLILDDFGMQPFDSASRGILMDIIEDRHGKQSTIITSQIPVKGWYDVIGEKTVADAILDRLVHHALRVELFGESIRRRKVKTEFE